MRELVITECPHLTHLPPFVAKWTELREITIEGCPKLTWLPSSMHSLPHIDFSYVLDKIKLDAELRIRDQVTHPRDAWRLAAIGEIIEDLTDFPPDLTPTTAEELYDTRDERVRWRLWTRFKPELFAMQDILSERVRNWVSEQSKIAMENEYFMML